MVSKEKFTFTDRVHELILFISKYPPATIICSDTSSLLFLAKAGILETLVNHYIVAVPNDVFEELALDKMEKFPETKLITELFENSKLRKIACSDDHASLFSESELKRLHKGERAVLLSYHSIAPCFILTDDKVLIKLCRKHSLSFTSAAIMPVMLFHYNKIGHAEMVQVVEAILKLGFFSRRIKSIIRKLLQVVTEKQ